jgi:lipopolysaccharide biosynthesis protein
MTSTAAPALAEPRVIAFYLPQFHTIPENDRWWGEGFTEWSNVRRARPNFSGHDQPRVPGELGAYDLRDPGVLVRQAALAREYGLHGFCYYYYWFDGKRLLERPVEAMRMSGAPDFPYCFCWPNENWTRRWDGGDNEILIAIVSSRENDERLIRDLLPHFRDPRYIRVAGRPLFIVYRVTRLPDAAATLSLWREICRKEGVGEIYVCAMKTYAAGDPSQLGFDAAVEFPPLVMQKPADNGRVDVVNPDFRGSIVDYRQVVVDTLAAAPPGYRLHRTVVPGWDNTARQQDHAFTLINASPEIYEIWLRESAARTLRENPPGERLVFVNAWNEWAEGAYLEPDACYGRQYLLATRRALAAAAGAVADPLPAGRS